MPVTGRGRTLVIPNVHVCVYAHTKLNVSAFLRAVYKPPEELKLSYKNGYEPSKKWKVRPVPTCQWGAGQMQHSPKPHIINMRGIAARSGPSAAAIRCAVTGVSALAHQGPGGLRMHSLQRTGQCGWMCSSHPPHE